MTITVQSIVDTVRLKYNDIEDTEALIYAKEVIAEVRSKLNLRKDVITISALAVGVGEYALDELALGVDEVRYQRSADVQDYRSLSALQGKDEAYSSIRDFQKLTNGEPTMFYLTVGTSGPLIGLIPRPDTATTGGYPRLEIDVSENQTLTLASTIYDDLPSSEVFTDGIKWKFAKDKYPEEAPGWEKYYRASIQRAQAYLYTKNRQAPPRMLPNMIRRRIPIR